MKQIVTTLTILCMALLTAVGCSQQADKVVTLENQEDSLVSKAEVYLAKMENYVTSQQGQSEIRMKNALRDAFLKCKGSYEEILQGGQQYGDEVVRRIKEWNLKVSKGLLEKKESSVSMKGFLEQAKIYSILHQKARDSVPYQEYKQAHGDFKETVMALLKAGVEPEEVNGALQKGGVTNKRILSRAAYWKKKDL